MHALTIATLALSILAPSTSANAEVSQPEMTYITISGATGALSGVTF